MSETTPRPRRARIAASALVVAGLLALTGCGGGDAAEPTPLSAADAAALAEPAVSLEPAEFANLAASDGVMLIDVRTAEEFAAGHLEGATLMSVEAADFVDQVKALDPAGTYALYCRSANRSRVAIDTMHALGFTAVTDLAGGINAWTGDGREVVTD